ncbi:BNR-4 repeat-containing protein [Pelagicoccus sp. SDUM812003]|uniref:BNR-4 repeat-containing protein n=1 Tax=Pelagicoccus sp. SDUM812003 TaxID=3041267 RepID=UPI00280C998A|nr:BNR-4 repeat-containing protein [Pelagicoccus sp. SDUM812003]MDQ8201440.1 BNR-4 repeat-containing protein [Pelagicoccus sp. SDUM812003]
MAKDTGWCWFQDPRAIILQGKLVIGGVDGQTGDVTLGVFDLATETALGSALLHPALQRDDHNAPALYGRPDGRLLAMWSMHGNEKKHYYRVSEADDFLRWGALREYNHDYADKRGVTYTNLYYLEDQGALYNIFRDGEHFNPCYIRSTDHGETWGELTHFITHDLGSRQRPYARYVQKDASTVAISFTDAHPRQYGNHIYYAAYRDGAFFRADGSEIKRLSQGPLRTGEAERVYEGSGQRREGGHGESAPNSAWTGAMAVDRDGNPHIGYSLYLTNEDHRYRLASWDGAKWVDREIAFAGNCLWDVETSYTGLLAFDPGDPRRVYISTDVDPATGESSGGVHEIYTAWIEAVDDVSTIEWSPITRGSEHRNIRPMVVAGDGYKALVWQNGPWTGFVNYDTDAVGLVLERP